MTPITDRDTYVNSMRKSLKEKMFFLKHINPDFVLDFGCADGALTEMIKESNPNINVWGYDNDPNMVESCVLNGVANYTGTLNFALNCAKYAPGTRVLILSSVLHELYCAYNHDEIRDFWNSIKDVGFDYIVIRDMLYDPTTCLVDSRDHSKVLHTFPNTASSFSSIWGSLANHRNFTHYLLKYRYKSNWTREVEEDYLSLNKLDLLANLLSFGYTPSYWNQHSLKFIREKVKEDFDIDFRELTHVKAIFRLKNQ